jgi:hypothetical protein
MLSTTMMLQAVWNTGTLDFMVPLLKRTVGAICTRGSTLNLASWRLVVAMLKRCVVLAVQLPLGFGSVVVVGSGRRAGVRSPKANLNVVFGC